MLANPGGQWYVRFLVVDSDEVYLRGLVETLGPTVSAVLVNDDVNDDLLPHGPFDVGFFGITDFRCPCTLRLARVMRQEYRRRIALLSADVLRFLHEVTGEGFDAYVHRSSGHEVIRQAIERVTEGGRFIDAQVAPWLWDCEVHTWSPFGLTPQEARVADLLADGASRVEIGAALFITENTVKFHTRNVYRKTGVSTPHGLRSLRSP